MGGISIAIELQDNFTGIMMNIVNAIHMTVAAVEQMQSVLGGTFDTNSIDQANEAEQALNDTLQNMELPSASSAAIDYRMIQPSAGQSVMEALDDIQIPVQAVVTEQTQIDVADNLNVPVESVVTEQPTVEIPNEVIAKQYLEERMDPVISQSIDIMINPVVPDSLVENTEAVVPVRWQSDNLNVFTNTSIERFRQEAQRTNAMLQQLSSTQAAIAKRAYNANIFLSKAFQNLNTIVVWIDNIRDNIQQIESNTLNMRMDAANAELEQLKVQMNQVVQVQELMNRAVQNMDVRSANEAYLRLLQMMRNTERCIQSNVDEQSCFNDGIQKGMDNAAGLKKRIVDAAQAIIKMDIKKLKDWIVDGITDGAVDWIAGCTAAFNAQLITDTRRISVLASMLDEEYVAQFAVEVSADTAAAVDEINTMQDSINGIAVPVTAEVEARTAAYAQITEKASEIQRRGVFGDEAMIAGAVKLSMYFSDQEAVMAMMDTLSDYAMGMNVLEGKGLTVDVNSMVGYATNLGKVMTGTYTAMNQKGFEFTDAQKAIIEGTATEVQVVEALGAEYLDMSTDMQAAAAIDSVIGRAWEGLYEIMSNTPEGKIIQMTNTWGNMKEVVGGQLCPYVLLFVDTITQNWGTIQEVIDNITFGLQVMLGVLSWLMEGAINFAQFVMDNWSNIGPVICGIVAALASYYVLQQLCAVVSAMMSAPILLAYVAIIAVIAAMYLLSRWIAEVTGIAGSGFGVFTGFINVVIQHCKNLALTVANIAFGIRNAIVALTDNIATAFHNAICSVQSWFYNLLSTVLHVVSSICESLNKLPFVEFDYSGITSTADEYAMKSQLASDGKKDLVSITDAFNEGFSTFDTFQEGWVSKAFEEGAAWGDGIEEVVKNFDILSLFGTTDIPSAEEYASALAGGGIGNDINNIAGNTGAMADAMAITEEELKYLRDIAEQEIINRFTTAEIHLEQTNHNTIKNGMDLDGIMSGMTDMMNEAIDISTEGVHV